LFHILLLHRQHDILIKKGAEADIYLTLWYGNKAVSKIRTAKPYRHRSLDYEIRKTRTIHEANIMSMSKLAGVRTPFIYFVDPIGAQIIMEFIDGENVKDIITPRLSRQLGTYTALLHINNIIHNDLTTSNFIRFKNGQLVLLDFGLSYYSERLEDRAVDIRLIKEVFYSLHVSIFDGAFKNFLKGYSMLIGERKTRTILEKVSEIEQRGRYARLS
jgi:TP53 regulating kinase-like protein